MTPLTEAANAYGLSHFLTQGSPAELAPLYLLVAMSVITWSVIVLKSIQVLRVRQQAGAFLRRCWAGGDAAHIGHYLSSHAPRDPWSRLTAAGLAARSHLASIPGDAPTALGTPNEFLTRVLRRTIGSETLDLEAGLTAVATVASTAPFVGLFGTVWGIYHALLAIGAGGQSSLDQVAGPVGETLIMTAFGLATALPAVLAYNVFIRSNRRILSDLDGFAHDLFVLLASDREPDEVKVAARRPPRHEVVKIALGEAGMRGA